MLTFPASIMQIKDIMAPTKTQFSLKINKKDDIGEGLPWFKQSKVTNTKVPIAQVAPCPAFLAFDALMDEIESHVIWE